MGQLYLYSLANAQREWLGTRQAAISQNIANANTPSFRTRDVAPFSDVIDRTVLETAATNPAHLTSGGAEPQAVEATEGLDAAETHNGNSVSLEREFVKAGEVSSAYALNVGVLKSFHRMLLATAKG